MGARKHNSAEAMKAARKELYFAKANGIPTSLRGMEVNRALGALHFSTREASRALEKLLKSAIANWETKTGKKAEDETLYVTKIMVDGGMAIKRMLPAPQGRAYRIRKRSNHVTIFVDTKNTNAEK